MRIRSAALFLAGVSAAASVALVANTVPAVANFVTTLSGGTSGTALPFSSEQVDLSNQMISYWGSFARAGDPNARLAPSWLRYTPQGTLLQLRAPSARRVGHAQIDGEHNCSLWDEVSPAP